MTQTTTTHTNTPQRAHPAVVRAALRSRLANNRRTLGRIVDPVYAGTSLVGLDQPLGMTEYVCPIQLVVERVKAVGRLLLGLCVELPL